MEGHVLWSGLKQFRDLRLGQPNRFILKPALDTRPSILEMSVTPRKLLRRIAEITTLPLCAKNGYFRQRNDELSYQGTAESPLCDCSFVADGTGREDLAHRTSIATGRYCGEVNSVSQRSGQFTFAR